MPTRPLSLLTALLFVAGGLTPKPVFAQAAPALRAGPMLGYNTLREVAVWVQTAGPASEVRLRYYPVDSAAHVLHSEPAATAARDAFCATLVADSLLPATTYRYEVLVDGAPVDAGEALAFATPALWEFRADPPEVTFALGSCYYANEPAFDRPGRGYGGEYGIFAAIDSLRPDFMLWLGDNIYLRPGDFQTRSGVLHRNSHQRAVAELQPLLRHTHHYAIWDDHDFGPNDADRSYVHKAWTREAFELFWANPPAHHPALAPGIATAFRYADAEFFLLDDRTFRAPNACQTCDPKPLLGEAQLDWLVDALVGSTASYKFVAVGGQVLNSVATYETYVSHHAAERERLLDRIAAEGIEGVVFLTGDRHHTELSRVTRGDVELVDFTVSPLTSGANERSRDEPNEHRVAGTWVGRRNFGTVTLRGPRTERVATLRIYDSAGVLLWERDLGSEGE